MQSPPFEARYRSHLRVTILVERCIPRFFLDAAAPRDHVSRARRAVATGVSSSETNTHAKRQSRYFADNGCCGLRAGTLTDPAVAGRPRR